MRKKESIDEEEEEEEKGSDVSYLKLQAYTTILRLVFLTFYYVFIFSMCVVYGCVPGAVSACACRHVETRGWHQGSSLIALNFLFIFFEIVSYCTSRSVLPGCLASRHWENPSVFVLIPTYP